MRTQSSKMNCLFLPAVLLFFVASQSCTGGKLKSTGANARIDVRTTQNRTKQIEAAKLAIQDSDLPESSKQEVARALEAAPLREDEQQQAKAILETLAMALADLRVENQSLSKLVLDSAQQLSELVRTSEQNVNEKMQSAPEIYRDLLTSAVEAIKNVGTDSETIAKAVLTQITKLPQELFKNGKDGLQELSKVILDTNVFSDLSTDTKNKLTEEFVLSKLGTNQAPTISAISNQSSFNRQSLSVSFTASDPDGPLSCSAANLFYTADNKTIIAELGAVTFSGTWPNCSATIAFIPKARGKTNLSFIVSDGSLTASSTFSIDVIHVNEKPSIAAIADTETFIGESFAVPLNITDSDGTLNCASSITVSSSNVTLFPVDQVTFTGSSPQCIANLPTNNASRGSVTLTFTVTDAEAATASQSFTLKVKRGWYQEAYIKAANADEGDFFGLSVDLSGDTLAVGSIMEDSGQTTISNGTSASSSNSVPDSGAVYVYKRSGEVWTQEAYIKAANPGTEDYFGYQIAVSKDTLVAGAYDEDSLQNTITNGPTVPLDNSLLDSGAAYVYRRSGTSWVQEAFVKPSNAHAEMGFGIRNVLSGGLLAVSAYDENSGQTFIHNGPEASLDTSKPGSGAVYVFRRTGTAWVQEAYIKASNADADDSFHALSLDNDTLAVGATLESSAQTTITNGPTSSSDNSLSRSGAVYVYRRTGMRWEQEAYIKAANAGAEDFFGRTISLSGDTLAVTARFEDSAQAEITNGPGASLDDSATDSGAVYVYRRRGSSWAHEAYLKASNAESGDSFGAHVSVSGDILAVGARQEDSSQSFITNGAGSSTDNSAADSGAVYVYERTGSTWAQVAYIKAANTAAGNIFMNISIQGDTLAVGAYLEDSDQRAITNGSTIPAAGTRTDSGAVYVYRNLDRLFDPQEVLTSSASTSSFSVEWSGKNLGTGNGTFKVVYDTTEPAIQCASGATAYTGTATTVTVSNGLSAGQTYYVRVCSTAGNTYSDGALARVTVRPVTIVPQVLSINRGTTPNPVPGTSNLVDFLVTFNTPVIGLSKNNFTFTEVGTSKGISGNITDIDCSTGNVCVVWAELSAAGTVRLDLSSASGITDTWGIHALSGTRTGDQTYTVKGWYQEAYIKAANAEASDEFGISISLFSDTLAVGAQAEDSNQSTITNGSSASTDNSAANAGAVYVYRRSSGSWAQEAYIKAANAGSSDNFGQAVALFNDTLAVGALYEDSNQRTITNGTLASADNSEISSGAVYVYKRTGANWAQEAYIKAADALSEGVFGTRLALYGDTLAVGATGHSSSQSFITNGNSGGSDVYSASSGAAYIFRRNGAIWTQEALIKATNNGAGDQFGRSLALDGDLLAVSAALEDSNQRTITSGNGVSSDNSASDAGAVYVFKRTGNTWAPEAYLKASNADANDLFGDRVALSGSTLAVGALYEDSSSKTITNGQSSSEDNSASNSGAVYIFKRMGGTWVQEAYIKSFNSTAGTQFGTHLSLYGDTLVVGAPLEDSNRATVNNDGSNITATSNTSLSNSGAAYVYQRSSGNWAQVAYLKAPNADSNDQFGFRVSVFGDTLAVTSRYEDSNQTTITNGTGASSDNSASNSGAVFVFRNTDKLFEAGQVLATSADSSSFSVSWTTSASGTGAGTAEVKVVYGTAEPASQCSSGTLAYSGTNNTTTVSTGLTPGTSYFVRICTYDGSTYSEGIVTQVNVQGTPSTPTVLSIVRGNTANPVPYGANLIDFVVAFSEPVIGLSAANFSFTEVSTSTGAAATFHSADCSSGNTCRVWVAPGPKGTFRMDLSNPSGITNKWGTALAGTRTGDETYTTKGWYQEAYIKAANAGAGDLFGTSISLSGDTLAIGAYKEDSNLTTITNGTGTSTDNSAADSGAVYIFKRAGSSWAQEAYIKASDANNSDQLGIGVSLSGDTLAAGAFGEDSSQNTITNGATASSDNSATTSGAAFIFTRSNNTWAQAAYIKAANVGQDDLFGKFVSLNGNTLAVTAHLEDSNVNTITNGNTASTDQSLSNSGAVYIYAFNGTLWEQQAFVKTPNIDSNDQLASSISLSGDTLAIGVTLEDSNQTTITNGSSASADNSLADSGAAYIFRRNANQWSQEAYIKAANASAGDYFGCSASISGDTLAVGSCYEDSWQRTITNGETASANSSLGNSGASYIYRRAATNWAQEAYIKAANARATQRFGYQTELRGNTLIISADQEDSSQQIITNSIFVSFDTSTTDSGAVYIFKRTGTAWAQEAFVKAANNRATNKFGQALAFSGDTVAVGVPLDDSNQTSITNGSAASLDASLADSGAVFVYRNTDRLFDPDIFVSSKTSTSITFNWSKNLGSTTQVKVAPAATGTNTPPDCNDASSITLSAGIETYTYSGLSSSTKYGFRFCAFDGASQVSEGTTLWEETNP